ncbi:MAG: hypothetical protein GWN67_12285 [Phycisphaerae bacterium]|nr:hypothetical protein [Phycisphaerae bacterium]NIR67178.1 hypothetical protein [candidate division Zixibacteria bacterium]NIP53632.1 hypothetical protein [Phycisphaerae bacterium]NIS51902.1 hypothetical protein [Phycisphaerae bacterium]NIU09413.1 hypothetical protein [Phycisphaerae bacterium]
MNRVQFSVLFLKVMLYALSALCLCSGCGSSSETAWLVGGIIGGTALAGQSPAQEIEQIYYLGVLDPMEQTPSAIFRLTVRGQASLISSTKFASGWAPADLVDSLNTSLSFNEQDMVPSSNEEKDSLGEMETGRRLILFGPEGYREAPKDHRLVLVMSSSPEKYFEALGETLGAIADVQVRKLDAEFHREVLRCLAQVRTEQKQLQTLREDMDRDFICQ